MAWRRAEFYFEVRGVLVRAELLGTKLEFDRGGLRVEILIPGNGADRHWEGFGAVKPVYGGEPNGHAFAVHTVKVMVFGEGPRGQDTAGSIEHLRKSFHAAESAIAELVEWARIHGQPWLGLHGQPVRRVGNHLLGDDSVDIADYGFSEDVLPAIEDEREPAYDGGASLDTAQASSLARQLDCGTVALPIAETLLADALYFIGLRPPDCQRAVLIAAIACEVKVKDTLRQKVPQDRRSLVDLLLENPRDWSIAALALFDKATDAALGRSLRTDQRNVYKDVCKLFEMRNRIAHRGEKPDEAEASRVVLASRQVFRWLDEL
jgi:hypothetical protein